jgi:hypothetical protein
MEFGVKIAILVGQSIKHKGRMKHLKVAIHLQQSLASFNKL